MSNQNKSFANRYKALLPKEPYEMTYWKNKLHSPLHRLIAFIKKRHAIYSNPFFYVK